MKITIAFILTAAAILLSNIEANNKPKTTNNNREEKMSAVCNNNGVWYQGNVPYEISQQFDGNDLNLIKETLVEIMKVTCIKFVPHTNEPDYIVFVEYKHPNQEKKTCWSGKKWDNNEIGTIGNQKGRHIVSLWRDLECFNKLDIIRHISNILGFQTKSSTLIFKSGRCVIYAAYKLYEEDFGNYQKQFNKTLDVFVNSCEKVFLMKYPYTADKKGWMEMARNGTCTVLRALIQINRMYNCPAISNAELGANISTNGSALVHVRPSCKTEAEAGTCILDPIYMGIVCKKSFCDGWGILYGNLSPHLRFLVNGFGKGIGPYQGQAIDGYTIHQWNPDWISWSWNEASLGSGDRHLCNELGKCLVSYPHIRSDPYLMKIDPGINTRQDPPYVRQDEPADKEGQRFYLLDLLNYPGFFTIKDELEKCVGIYGNTDGVYAEVRAIDCNPSEAGQRWKWSYA